MGHEEWAGKGSPEPDAMEITRCYLFTSSAQELGIMLYEQANSEEVSEFGTEGHKSPMSMASQRCQGKSLWTECLSFWGKRERLQRGREDLFHDLET